MLIQVVIKGSRISYLWRQQTIYLISPSSFLRRWQWPSLRNRRSDASTFHQRQQRRVAASPSVVVLPRQHGVGAELESENLRVVWEFSLMIFLFRYPMSQWRMMKKMLDFFIQFAFCQGWSANMLLCYIIKQFEGHANSVAQLMITSRALEYPTFRGGDSRVATKLVESWKLPFPFLPYFLSEAIKRELEEVVFAAQPDTHPTAWLANFSIRQHNVDFKYWTW